MGLQTELSRKDFRRLMEIQESIDKRKAQIEDVDALMEEAKELLETCAWWGNTNGYLGAVILDEAQRKIMGVLIVGSAMSKLPKDLGRDFLKWMAKLNKWRKRIRDGSWVCRREEAIDLLVELKKERERLRGRIKSLDDERKDILSDYPAEIRGEWPSEPAEKPGKKK